MRTIQATQTLLWLIQRIDYCGKTEGVTYKPPKRKIELTPIFLLVGS